MDEDDRRILNIIQSGFPVCPQPYLDLAKSLDISEEEVFKRVKRLKTEGIIRRIGGNMNSLKLNFASTLCAAMVPEEKIALFVETVNSYKGVTHNYLRKNAYNIWFTFIGPTADDIKKWLEEITEKTGVNNILNMPALRTFKIMVDFEV
jgi:siroheme decarboxylase